MKYTNKSESINLLEVTTKNVMVNYLENAKPTHSAKQNSSHIGNKNRCTGTFRCPFWSVWGINVIQWVR